MNMRRIFSVFFAVLLLMSVMIPELQTIATDPSSNEELAVAEDEVALEFAYDRIIVQLAGNINRGRGPMVTLDSVDSYLDIEFAEVRLLNPAPENNDNFVLLSESDSGNQNNVILLTLHDYGREYVLQALKMLESHPGVAYVSLDFKAIPTRTPNDPRFRDQYAIQRMNLQQAWNITTGSRDIIIGISDTGIEGAHPDLNANLWNNPDPNQFPGVTNDIHGFCFYRRVGGMPTERPDSQSFGHGTRVAGAAGAVGDNGVGIVGVNWNVSLAWLGTSGLSDIVEAINYAQNHNFHIINASWTIGRVNSALLRNAIANFDGLFICAAGNSGLSHDTNPRFPASFDLPNLIAVANTTREDAISGGLAMAGLPCTLLRPAQMF